MIKSGGRAHANAKNSLNGLCRQAVASLLIPRIALPAVAFFAASAAFQCVEPARTQFCALDSRLRRRASGYVANSNCCRDVGRGKTYWLVTLARLSALGLWHSLVSGDRLPLIVVGVG